MTPQFSDLYPYDSDTVRRIVPVSSGVYRLCYKGIDGKFHVFYVGQSVDLEERLLAHLQPSEPNDCVRDMVRTATCRFQWIVVRSQGERDKLEASEIAHFNPRCNTRR